MKKIKIKKSKFDVDGPFERAKERLASFSESTQYAALIQKTIDKLKIVEEEIEMALYMDDPELLEQKKEERKEILTTLAYASTLLEKESGISG